MSYATNAKRANPAAMLGALGVPAAFGAILVVGLAVEITERVFEPNPEGTQVDVPLPPPPPEPQPTAQPESSRSANNTLEPTLQNRPSRPDSQFVFDGPTAPIGPLPGTGDGIGDLGGFSVAVPRPTPSPSFSPVSPEPRGNPGDWITNRDYRTSWINRGLEGIAGFTVQIDSRGRVNDCTITRSTGHAALDTATCRLVERRARFEPARDSTGNIVPGTYSNSVAWEIPE